MAKATLTISPGSGVAAAVTITQIPAGVTISATDGGAALTWPQVVSADTTWFASATAVVAVSMQVRGAEVATSLGLPAQVTLSGALTMAPQAQSQLAVVGGLAGLLTAKQTALVTNNSNVTPSDIPGLVVPVVNGHQYDFQAYLTCQTDLATAGPLFTATTPALTSGRWTVLEQLGASGTAQWLSQTAAFGGAAGYSAGTFSVGAAADFSVEIRGRFKPSADGTVQLRMRSSTNAQVMTAQNEGVMRLVDLG